jgi:pentapeptide MXKDX repeat protein
MTARCYSTGGAALRRRWIRVRYSPIREADEWRNFAATMQDPKEIHMNKIATAVMSACLMCAVSSVYAQDAMKKDDASGSAMSHDAMKKDSMSKDGMSHDAMKKDSMSKDGMSHDAMKKDSMSKDGMKSQ